MNAITYQQEATTVTPDMARTWLDVPTERQRQLIHSHIGNLAKQMTMGRYVFTPEPIMLGVHGEVVDGQHRLWAVIESGIPTRFMVAYGVDSAVFDHINKGVKRTASQFIAHRNRSTIAGAAKVSLLWYETDGAMLNWTGATNVFTDEMILGEWETESVYGERAQVCALIQREARVNSAMTLALARLTWEGAEEEVWNDWATGLLTGADLSHGDPRLTLRNKFMQDYRALNNSANRRRAWAYIVKAWNAHASETSLSVLRFRAASKNYAVDPGEQMPKPLGA